MFILLQGRTSAIDYEDALNKSLLFFEGQRSGKLPSNQRVQWRADSALNDGRDPGVNLVGGYYDAGDNVKFGFPLAFTVTLLSWLAVEFDSQLRSGIELGNALAAIKWGTDYLIKAHPRPNVLYGQVADGNSDHSYWMKPEDMTPPRTSYRINAQNPGTDLAAKTATALAATSIAFWKSNASYASELQIPKSSFQHREDPILTVVMPIQDPNFQQAEPTTFTAAAIVGLLAKLSA